jgi:hypothetical protein
MICQKIPKKADKECRIDWTLDIERRNYWKLSSSLSDENKLITANAEPQWSDTIINQPTTSGEKGAFNCQERSIDNQLIHPLKNTKQIEETKWRKGPYGWGNRSTRPVQVRASPRRATTGSSTGSSRRPSYRVWTTQFFCLTGLAAVQWQFGD